MPVEAARAPTAGARDRVGRRATDGRAARGGQAHAGSPATVRRRRGSPGHGAPVDVGMGRAGVQQPGAASECSRAGCSSISAPPTCVPRCGLGAADDVKHRRCLRARLSCCSTIRAVGRAPEGRGGVGSISSARSSKRRFRWPDRRRADAADVLLLAGAAAGRRENYEDAAAAGLGPWLLVWLRDERPPVQIGHDHHANTRRAAALAIARLGDAAGPLHGLSSPRASPMARVGSIAISCCWRCRTTARSRAGSCRGGAPCSRARAAVRRKLCKALLINRLDDTAAAQLAPIADC